MYSGHIISLVTALLSSVLAPVVAQTITFDSIHNKTSLTGTWSSGAKNVVTGSDFANPANISFNYPATTGVSYSFTDDGYYEVARYRFTSNATQPSCITGVLNWAHGTYDLLSNGSIIMTPFGDGFQQVQDPCAAVSNFFENFNYTELYQQWRIFQDPTDGYKLHLFEFDGTPVAPCFQVSTTPNMLPTQSLRNVTGGFTTQDGFVTPDKRSVVVKRGIPEPVKRSAASGSRSWSLLESGAVLGAIAGITGLVAL